MGKHKYRAVCFHNDDDRFDRRRRRGVGVIYCHDPSVSLRPSIARRPGENPNTHANVLDEHTIATLSLAPPNDRAERRRTTLACLSFAWCVHMSTTPSLSCSKYTRTSYNTTKTTRTSRRFTQIQHNIPTHQTQTPPTRSPTIARTRTITNTTVTLRTATATHSVAAAATSNAKHYSTHASAAYSSNLFSIVLLTTRHTNRISILSIYRPSKCSGRCVASARHD